MSLGRPSVMASLGDGWHGLEAAQNWSRSLGVQGGGVLSTGLKLLHPHPILPGPDPAHLAWGALPPGRPWLHLAPALSRRAPASALPPPCGSACPVAGVLVVDGGRAQAQAQPTSRRDGQHAFTVVSTRPGQEWGDNGPSQLLFPQGGASLAATPPSRVVPPHPNAWLGAAAACVPCHRRTCFPATLCLCC